MTVEILTLSAALMKDHLPSEIGDSDTYNRIPMRSDPPEETSLGTARELLRVLIVDDHRDSADTMGMLVGAWGHDVRQAYNGTTALALAAACEPDVLLLDIMMPNMNGVELALQVRRQTRLNDCLIIAVTGCTGAGHRLQCEEAGIDLFLIKPVDLSSLRTLLAEQSEIRLRSREDRAHYVLTTMQQPTDSNSPRPTQLPYQVLQEIVTS